VLVTIQRNENQVVRIRREAPNESSELPARLVLKQSLIGHLEQISSLTYSHDGNLLASGDDFGKVRVWNTLDGTLRYHLPELGTPVSGITFSPDSKYLLTSMTNDGSEGEYPIYIWDASTGEPQGELRQHKRGIFSLSFSADGKKLLSAGWEPKLFVWDFSARTLNSSTPSPTGDWVRSATYSPTGQIAVASGNLVFLIPPDGQVSPPLHQGDGPISFFSPDGSRLAATWWREGSVHVWDVETQKLLAAWKAHDGKINSAAFSNDKRILATCGNDRAIRVWNVETQTLLAEEVSVSRVYWLEFSPDGKTLATGGIDDRLVKLWDVSLPEPAAGNR
jgi:WD40 repeat protein